jgi:hypothetical protein
MVSSCNYWWHIKCGKITPDQYKTLSNSDDPWICHDCSYFQFSDSFFDGSIPSTDNDENGSDDDYDIFTDNKNYQKPVYSLFKVNWYRRWINSAMTFLHGKIT